MGELLENEMHLLKALAQGDEVAFAELYHHYQPILHDFLFPLTSFSKEDTDEILQDIFLKLWLRKEALLAVRSLRSYLFRMAKNRLLDKRASSIRSLGAVHGWQYAQQQAESGEGVQEKVLLEEYHELARQAIGKLSPQKRRILLMRNEAGLSLDEIAEELSITKFAVKKQLYEALKALRDHLKSHHGLDIPVAVLLISNLC